MFGVQRLPYQIIMGDGDTHGYTFAMIFLLREREILREREREL